MRAGLEALQVPWGTSRASGACGRPRGEFIGGSSKTSLCRGHSVTGLPSGAALSAPRRSASARPKRGGTTGWATAWAGSAGRVRPRAGPGWPTPGACEPQSRGSRPRRPLHRALVESRWRERTEPRFRYGSGGSPKKPVGLFRITGNCGQLARRVKCRQRRVLVRERRFDSYSTSRSCLAEGAADTEAERIHTPFSVR